jgi:phospholipid-binding lipoprotein MlaA
MTTSRRVLAAVAVALAVALAGCATSPGKNEDPWEPMNRSLYKVHDALDRAVLHPVTEGYVKIVPDFIRKGVSNVFNNIDDAFSAINGVLQWKLDKAGNDLGRVMVNSLFGVAGLIDVASDLGIERGNEDFGLTFAHWGLPPGPYLFVPGFGPTTIRDGSGVIVRIATGPVSFIPDVNVRNVLWGVGFIDQRSQLLGVQEIVETAALDKYAFIRNAYFQRRRYLFYDGKPPPEDEDEEDAKP